MLPLLLSLLLDTALATTVPGENPSPVTETPVVPDTIEESAAGGEPEPGDEEQADEGPAPDDGTASDTGREPHTHASTGEADEATGEADDAPTGEADEASDDFAAVLEEAKRLYFAGRAEQAHEILRGLQVRLLMGEPVPPDLSAEALIWLGEIQYKLGRASDAREAFRWLLQRDPEYPISPYAHPMEVVGEFELVRREVQDQMAQSDAQPPVTPAPPPPAPGWVWAPLGIPQLAQRRVGTGLALGGLQVGLGAAALGMHVHLRSINPKSGETHPRGWSEEVAVRRIQTQRYLVQWPLTFAFYGAWLASSLEARGHWRASHRPRPRVGLGPLPDGSTGLIVSGGF